MSLISRSFSASDPSHHTIRSGVVCAATCSTHCSTGLVMHFLEKSPRGDPSARGRSSPLVPPPAPPVMIHSCYPHAPILHRPDAFDGADDLPPGLQIAPWFAHGAAAR